MIEFFVRFIIMSQNHPGVEFLKDDLKWWYKEKKKPFRNLHVEYGCLIFKPGKAK